jgi:hypothetical protein
MLLHVIIHFLCMHVDGMVIMNLCMPRISISIHCVITIDLDIQLLYLFNSKLSGKYGISDCLLSYLIIWSDLTVLPKKAFDASSKLDFLA